MLHKMQKRLCDIKFRLLFVVLLAVSCAFNSVASENINIKAVQETITNITADEGPFSENLYPHIKMIAISQFREARYKKAIRNFKRMQNLVHRQYGVNSTLQFESIDLLIRVYKVTGEVGLIDRLEEFRFSVAKENFVNSEEMLYPMMRIASWYRDTRRYRQALDLYQQSKQLILEQHLPLSKAVTSLRSEALTLYLADICCAQKPLQEIALSGHGDLSEQARAFSEVADMLFMLGENKEAIRWSEGLAQDQPQFIITNWQPRFLGFKNQRGVFNSYMQTETPYYSEALMQVEFVANESTQVARASSVIGNPVPLCRQGSSNLLSRKMRKLDSYFVDVDLKVSKNGHASDITLKGNAPWKLQRYLRNILRQAKFRPGIENNKVVDNTALSFRQTFDINATTSDWGVFLSYHGCGMII